jgi:hypothetical protein
MGLLKIRGLEKYQSGKLSKDQFADNLSKEWASLPYNTGASYYSGVGSNKSSGSRDELISSLPPASSNQPAMPAARTGGIFKGPSTGYNVELHGEEAVVPMNDGVNKQALNTSVFNQDTQLLDGITAMMAMMTDKYDQLIDLMSRNVDNGEKLVNATV